MSNKANQESICTNGTLNILQSPQGAENRAGTQTLVDTSAEQKGRDLYIQAESCHDRAAPPAEQQAASSAVLKAIREANMQLVRTGDDAFMLVPYKVATAEQAVPKAAPGELKDHQILAITTAYEQGVGKGHQAYKSGKEIANPYDSAYGCDLAWHYGYGEGKEQAKRMAQSAPQQEAQQGAADGFFLLLPQRPKPEAPAGTAGLDWDAYSGAQMLAFGRDCSDAANAALRTQQPAPATQQAGDVVAYLDVGAGGYLDLGPELSEDALQQLPKGRHALVIAGTYGIDGYVAAPQPSPTTTKAAPQQEAQEPAAFIHWPINGPPRLVWYSQKALNDAILKTHEDGYKPDVKLYTAPQPAPAAQGDAIEHELAMLIRRIVSSARRNCEDGSNVLKLANEAWAYLVRKGLNGSPLRDAGIESDPTPPAKAADSVQEDAARWQMVVLVGNEVMLHPDKRSNPSAVKAYMDAVHSGLDLTGAVDAARKQGANHDNA